MEWDTSLKESQSASKTMQHCEEVIEHPKQSDKTKQYVKFEPVIFH